MTLESTTNSITYTGDGIRVLFPYTFRIIEATDLIVMVDEVIYTNGSQYTIDGVGETTGGNVTFKISSTPANGADILFYRRIPLTQPTDYIENDPFHADTIETDLDRIVMMIQDINAVSESDLITVSGILQSYIDNTTNPHQVTLEQVRAQDNVISGSIDFNNNSATDISYIDFNTTVTGLEHTTGRMYWDDDSKTISVDMVGNDVTLQVGQEQLRRVRNKDTVPITNGTLVYVSGSTGDFPEVKRASATSAMTAYVYGMVTQESIGVNRFGYVTLTGFVRDINTGGFIVGVPIWLSETPGGYTQTPPAAPNIRTQIGYLVRAHATEGIIDMAPDTIPPLRLLSDIEYTASISNNAVPTYNTASGTFQLTDTLQEQITELEARIYYGG